MTDNSDTTAHDESNRISALSALYAAEQSTLNTLDGQVLVLAGLLVTYGIAAVAALGTEGAIRAGWMFVALPIPAWILLAYNALLWNKVATHTTAAKAYKAALETIASTAVADTVPTRDEWKPWARGVFGIVGSRLLSYFVAFVLILVFTAVMLYQGSDTPWYWLWVVLYVVGLVIVGTEWAWIIYRDAHPRFKSCMDRIFLPRAARLARALQNVK